MEDIQEQIRKPHELCQGVEEGVVQDTQSEKRKTLINEGEIREVFGGIAGTVDDWPKWRLLKMKPKLKQCLVKLQ